ncbi:MAG: helix-turn-helix transcriptional regulator [Eubacteriales bacterium]|nr:helix-turn-helix transcriptional regulator [Eubacteriales bacterium]
MAMQRRKSGEKNFTAPQLIELRKYKGVSQRELAQELQLIGCDIDKNVITRIETYKRYVNDLELKALSQLFQVSYSYLIDGVKTEEDEKRHPELKSPHTK